MGLMFHVVATWLGVPHHARQSSSVEEDPATKPLQRQGQAGTDQARPGQPLQMPYVAHVLHVPCATCSRISIPGACANRRAAFIELRLSTTVCSWQLSHPSRTWERNPAVQNVETHKDILTATATATTYAGCACNIVAPLRGSKPLNG